MPERMLFRRLEAGARVEEKGQPTSVVRIVKSLGLYRTAQRIRDRRLRGKRLAFYSMIIKPKDLCFDIGANVGNHTDIFLRLGAKVVAIEPQIEPFQYLIKRFGKNSNFFAINKALGAEQGSAEMLARWLVPKMVKNGLKSSFVFSRLIWASLVDES